MNVLTKLTNLFTKSKTYSLIEVKSETTDVVIKHASGVVIQIELDGTVLVSTQGPLQLYSGGDMELKSDTHIGLVAPRIDLN